MFIHAFVFRLFVHLAFNSFHLPHETGSPVWKPRDMISLGDAQPTSRKDDSKN